MGRTSGSAWFQSYLAHGMAGGATSVLIPLFAYALGGGLEEVGIVAAATSVASVPAFILWGLLSDRLSRRKVFLLLGFLGTAASFVAMALSSTIGEFYAANVLIGFLGSASAPVGAVLVMETAERRQWPARLALLSRMGSLGWVAGLSFGSGWLAVTPAAFGQLEAMRVLFLLGAGMSVVAAVLAGLWLPEPAEKLRRRDIRLVDVHLRIERVKYMPLRLLHVFDPRNHRRRIALPRALKAYLVSVLLLFVGFTAFYGFFPIFLTEAYALPSSSVFLVYIASQLAATVGYASAGRWVATRGSRPMQVYAAVGRAGLFPSFFAISLLPAPPSVHLGLVVAAHAGVGLCWAILNVAGATLVSRLAPEHAHAEAMGAYNATQGVGSIVGPLLGGFVAQRAGYGAAFGATVGFVLAGAFVLAAIRVPEK